MQEAALIRIFFGISYSDPDFPQQTEASVFPALEEFRPP
jgi:hypothetical protein